MVLAEILKFVVLFMCATAVGWLVLLLEIRREPDGIVRFVVIAVKLVFYWTSMALTLCMLVQGLFVIAALLGIPK